MSFRRQFLMAMALIAVAPLSLASELDALVKLCATQPESSEFETAWSVYVTTHFEPGMDLDRLIETVLSKADRYRWSRHASTGQLNWSSGQRQRIRQGMQLTAMAAIERQVANAQAARTAED